MPPVQPFTRLRRLLYRLASLLGDAVAVTRGPVAIGKRTARKAAGRRFGRLTRWK